MVNNLFDTHLWRCSSWVKAVENFVTHRLSRFHIHVYDDPDYEFNFELFLRFLLPIFDGCRFFSLLLFIREVFFLLFWCGYNFSPPLF